MKSLYLMKSLVVTMFAVTVIVVAGVAAADGEISTNEELARLMAGLDTAPITSGILYDRAVPLSRIGDYDGSPASTAITPAEWRQVYFELRHAARTGPRWTEPGELRANARERHQEGLVPLALMALRYHRIRPGPLEDGTIELRGDRLVGRGNDLYQEESLFAGTALTDHTYRGSEMRFVLDRERIFTHDGRIPEAIEFDAGDGLGWRPVRVGESIDASYASAGRKTLRLRSAGAAGTLETAFAFDVHALMAPSPHDTLEITATIPWGGQAGSGRGYVYLAPGHAAITNPVVVIEGFDLDNTMSWDELYALLNQQNMLETLRAEGFDAVVLDFTEATDPLQRNAFVIERLLEEVRTIAGSSHPIVLAGASMGGLASRYALAWMEANSIPHGVRTFISFDAPQRGANIPLGMQYWLAFFAGLSAEAEYLLSRLDTPAARQMLVYHHTDPPGPTGQSDPLRAAFEADLASLGDWPDLPRLVAMANGSGLGTGQGFAAGDQVIRWTYSSLVLNIRGHIWAVPDATSGTIFDGRIAFIFLPPTTQVVTVSGTDPFDNAPGGWRPSMAQMDSVAAPYGDIVALHPAHCFIPVVSALAIDTDDLFYDIAGDPDLLAHTPFDVVYYPAPNQEHVEITPENAEWFLDEVRGAMSDVAWGKAFSAGRSVRGATPNPFGASTTIRFELARAERVRLSVYDATGREVRSLLDQELAAGAHATVFHAEDLASGVYLYRLRAGETETSGRIVVLR